MKRHVGLMVAGVFAVTACTAAAQEAPPAPPVVPQTAPPAQPPASTSAQVPVESATPAEAAIAPLTPEEMRQRRNAIFLMEGVLIKAVRLGAARTASEIQNVYPGVGMFTSAPARAYGIALDGYGVIFQIEIPGVMPSVVSIIDTLERQRQGNPARQTALAGASVSEEPLNPDAHYVESVKRQLIDAMLDHSKSLDLRPGEWLTVAAREAEEAPGQIAEPSIMILRVRGADLTEFLAGRLSREEVRKRVQVRGF